jgi:hypothetical protein
MTDRWAARVEQLLGYQSLQLDQLYIQLMAIEAALAPKSKRRLAAEIKRAHKQTESVLSSLERDVRSEGKERDEIDTLNLLMEIRRRPVGFKPD